MVLCSGIDEALLQIGLEEVHIVRGRGGVWNLISLAGSTHQEYTCACRNVGNVGQQYLVGGLVVARSNVGAQVAACEVEVLRAAEGSIVTCHGDELLR